MSSVMPVWTEGVSVVIPARDAEKSLPGLFRDLRGCEVLEVLLCDAGSSDGTLALARDHGANVFRASGELWDALNRAARNARGTALWFVPPEAALPPLAAAYILEALAEKGCVGGCFSPARHGAAGWLRSRLDRMRAGVSGKITLANCPFLDHGVFNAVGGFAAGPDPVAELLTRAADKGSLHRFGPKLQAE